MLDNTFLLNTVFDKRCRKGKITNSSIKEKERLKQEEEERKREEFSRYKHKIAKDIQTSLTLLSTLLSYQSTLLFIVGDSTSVLREMYHSLPEAICNLHKRHKTFNDNQGDSSSSFYIVPHYAVVSGPAHCAHNKCYIKIESTEEKNELVKSNSEHHESMATNNNNNNNNDDKIDNDIENKTREDDNAKDGYEWTEHFLEQTFEKNKNKSKANFHEKFSENYSYHMMTDVNNSNRCSDKLNTSNLSHVHFTNVKSVANILEEHNNLRKPNVNGLQEEGNDIYNRSTSNSISSYNKVKYQENHVRWFLPIFITSLNDISQAMHKWSPKERLKHFRLKSTMKLLCFVNTDLLEEVDEIYYQRWFARNIMPKKEKFNTSNAAVKEKVVAVASQIVLLSVPTKYNYKWDVPYSAQKTFNNNKSNNNNHEGSNLVRDRNMNATKNNELNFTTPITEKAKIVNNNDSDSTISMRTYKYPALHLQSIRMKEFSEIVENEWRTLREKESCQTSKARKTKCRAYADDISLNTASEFFRSLRRQTGQNREVGLEKNSVGEHNNCHKETGNHFESFICNEIVQNTSKSNSLVEHREHYEKCNTSSKFEWWMLQECKPLIFATAENVCKAYANAHNSNRVDAKTIIHLTNTYSTLPSEINSSALAQMTPRCYYPLVTQLGSLLSTRCCISDIYLLQFNDKMLHINNQKMEMTNENAWVCDEVTNKRFSMFSVQIRVADRELCNSTYHYMRSNVCDIINNSNRSSTCTSHVRSCEENLYFAVASFVKTLLSTRLVLLWRVANSFEEHVKFAMCVSYEHYPLQWATIKRRQALMRREMRCHRAGEFEPVEHESNSESVTEPVVESLSTQLEWVMQSLRIRGWVVIAQDTHQQHRHSSSLHLLAENEQVKQNVGTYSTLNVEELAKSNAFVQKEHYTEPALKCVSANNTVLEEDVNAKGENGTQEHRECEQECTCEPICTNYHTNWQLWQAALVPESFDMHLWVGQHVFLLDGRCGVVHSFLPPPLELLDAGVQEFFSSPPLLFPSLRLSHYGLTNECHNTTNSALALHKPELYYDDSYNCHCDDDDDEDIDDDNNSTNRDKKSTISNATNNDSISNNRYWIEQAYAHATFLKWYIPNVYARKRQWTCKDGKVVMMMKDKCEENNELVPHSLYDKFTLPDYLEKMECHAWPVIQLCKTKELIHILPTDVRIGKIDYPTLCYVSAEERMRKEHKLNIYKESEEKREDECCEYEENKFYEDATWQIRMTSKNCRATIAMLPIRTKAYYSVFDISISELFEELRYNDVSSIATDNQFVHKKYYEKYKTLMHSANRSTLMQNQNCNATPTCTSTPHISPQETEFIADHARKYKLEWSQLHEMRAVCNYRSIVDIDKKMSTYLTSATHTSLV